MARKLELLDCTLRDGGYINNWDFDKKLAREMYAAISKSGVDIIEMGYFEKPAKPQDTANCGAWRFTQDADVRQAVRNINGAKTALMVDFGKVKLADIPAKSESVVDMIRVAANKDKMAEALAFSEKVHKKGYMVSINAMGYTNYSLTERKEFARTLKDTAIDYVYVADSYGALFPDEVPSMFEPLMGLQQRGMKIGFHPHNNIQMAFANTLAAISCGVDIVDSSVYGMGRAAGNLQTEIIVSYLEHSNKDKYNVIPILNLIDMYFINMQKENHWGYQLPYMLSGMFQIHPNYAKYLVGLKEYTMEDMWKALEYVKNLNPIGFSKEVIQKVESSGIGRGTAFLDMKSKKIVSKPEADEAREKVKVSYLNRHKDRDFMIIANGPSLVANEQKINDFIEKYKPVVMAGNYIGNILNLDYHAFSNKRRFISYIDTVSPKAKLLLGPAITDDLVRKYTDRSFERLHYVDELNHKFDIKNGVVQTNCRTIAVLLMGIAITMGAKRLFCAGMDGYMNIGDSDKFHFYNEKEEIVDKELILERHFWNLKFIEQIDEYLVKHQKEGVHILTPTSYKKFYKGIGNYI